MPFYSDTNAMWRRFAPDDAGHPVVKAAMDTILRQGETLHISAQNLIEFQSVATRPIEGNGLGLTSAEANEKAHELEAFFEFLPDTPDIYLQWRSLVEKYDVRGKQVHDARLVAVMLSYGLTDLLTLNPSDFRRFTEINVVEPKDVQ